MATTPQQNLHRAEGILHHINPHTEELDLQLAQAYIGLAAVQVTLEAQERAVASIERMEQNEASIRGVINSLPAGVS